MEPTVITK